jgi:hypothetical protein
MPSAARLVRVVAFASVGFAIAPLAAADTVRATVVDGATLEPIPHATVRIGDRAVIAGDDGGLVIETDRDAVDVTASAPGYEPATQTVPAGEPTMVLLFSPDALEVIEVKAQAPRSVTDGGYVLGTEEIRNLPGGSTDALAAVRSLPGVSQAPQVVSGGRLVIRGGGPQDSLLTLDGVPVPYVYHSFDNTTILPVSMIGAIAYSPGGFGVDEGRATSGSVALTTTDEPPVAPTAMAQLSMLDVAAAGAMPLSKRHGARPSTCCCRSPCPPISRSGSPPRPGFTTVS